MVESGLPKRSESRVNFFRDLKVNKPGNLNVKSQVNEMIGLEYISIHFVALVAGLFFNLFVLIIEIIFFFSNTH